MIWIFLPLALQILPRTLPNTRVSRGTASVSLALNERRAGAEAPLPRDGGARRSKMCECGSILAQRSLERRAEPLHCGAEFGKAGRNHCDVVNRHRLPAREPHDEEAHRNSVIHLGRDKPAAARAPAFDDEIVAGDGAADAGGLEAGSDCGETIAFLDPQFAQAPHARRATSKGGGD